MSKPICKLIGEDGNIFNLLSIVRRTLINNGLEPQAEEVVKRVMSSDSYPQALNILSEYVEIV
ncbi:MAG: hypothetical protein ACRC7S_17475 [Cetobacterium sp.]